MKKLFLIILLLASPIGPATITQKALTALRNIVSEPIGLAKLLADSVSYSSKEHKDSTPRDEQTYDFIVVGAGSAGAAVASRLSEIEEANVLLIEAGGHEELLMDIPVAAPFLQFLKPLHWDYASEPSKDYCRGLRNARCSLPSGKVMGGSSITNFMMAVRGNKDNYDRWADLAGDASWSYDNFLKYLKKLENADLTLAAADPAFRNSHGPVRIANAAYRSPLVEAYIEAGEELNLPAVDYNGANQTGFSYLQVTQVNGERLSSNRAYLHPIKDRKNLVVSMRSRVDKILIDRETKVAYGVQFVKGGKRIRVKASKEVIVCAGAVNSPKLLMLSGIGPAEHLRSLNIDVLKDSPVGENLMDHVAYGGLTFLVNESVGFVVPDLLNPANPALSDYLTKRRGLFTLPAGIEAVGLVNVDDPTVENQTPNIELAFASAQMGSSYLLHRVFGIREDNFWKSFGGVLYRHGWTVWPILMQPKSRGKILLRSARPTDKPKLYPNYFADPDDVRVAVKGIRMAIDVSRTRAMQRYDSTLLNFTVPGCEDYRSDSDDYWECALRTYTFSIYHYSGTCKMGREDDASAVVNSKLQVIGIKNLRVADSSIMPMIITGHTNVPVMAIAEKIADVIKSDWGLDDA